MPDPGFVKVAQVDEIPPGQMKMVEVGADQVLLVNVQGTIHACADVCTHSFASLSEGDLEGEVVRCPLHGADFNVITGEALSPPAEEKLQTYQVRVAGKDVLLGPPKA
jgi:nitrite reductase/ring-hydroxylating ferredoxin subunit